MKILKRIGIGLLVIVGLIAFSLELVLIIDSRKTSYLNLADGEANSYLIQNVNIIPMTPDTVLVNQDVRIENGRIAAVGIGLDASNVEVINGDGKYLLPGLADMHVHVWDRYELGLYLANGVTSVRNLWGQPMHLRIKEDINEGEIVGPMFFTSGPKLTGSEFIGDDNLQLFSPEEGRSKVIEYKDRGYDFIKTYYGLDAEIFEAVVDECKNQQLDIATHPSNKVSYSYHFQEPIKSIEHAEDIVQLALNYQLDTTELKNVVALYSSNPETPICPTITVYYNIYRMLTEDNILSSEALGYLNPLIKMVDSPAQVDRWTNTKAQDSTITDRIFDQHNFHLLALKKIHEAGGKIICGTDAGIGVTVPGYSIHDELAFYKEVGLTNYEVLKTATINASETHDFLRETGTIESGNYANLILVNGNPLDNLEVLKKPSEVFIKGHKLDRERLNQFEEKALNRQNKIASGLRYAEYLIMEK